MKIEKLLPLLALSFVAGCATATDPKPFETDLENENLRNAAEELYWYCQEIENCDLVFSILWHGFWHPHAVKIRLSGANDVRSIHKYGSYERIQVMHDCVKDELGEAKREVYDLSEDQISEIEMLIIDFGIFSECKGRAGDLLFEVHEGTDNIWLPPLVSLDPSEVEIWLITESDMLHYQTSTGSRSDNSFVECLFEILEKSSVHE